MLILVLQRILMELILVVIPALVPGPRPRLGPQDQGPSKFEYQCPYGDRGIPIARPVAIPLVVLVIVSGVNASMQTDAQVDR